MLLGVARLAFADPIADEFAAHNISGTLVVSTADGVPVYTHNHARARQRFSPASTFKILNTLIGLKYGAADPAGTPFVWDGVKRNNPAWNQNHSLQSAFTASCVWCYQSIARRVGIANYRAELSTVGYGNQIVGTDVTRFWLDGTLTISAQEQAEFLQRLYRGRLPYQPQHLAQLKGIMLQEQHPAYSLYAKSGWAAAGINTGWYTGFVETRSGAWIFAMNMLMTDLTQAPHRREIVLAALRHLGVI